MSQILPSLYVGSIYDAHNRELMAKIGITHIVVVHETAAPFDDRYQFFCIVASDDSKENLSKYFSMVNDFIHEGRAKGSVLIHCVLGRSRSVTFAVAYVMTVANLSFDDALAVVKHGRHIANPIDGFKDQLRHFNFRQEIERFRRKYDRRFDRFNDYQECRNILSILSKLKRSKA